jgi:hypothetical protein
MLKAKKIRLHVSEQDAATVEMMQGQEPKPPEGGGLAPS